MTVRSRKTAKKSHGDETARIADLEQWMPINKVGGVMPLDPSDKFGSEKKAPWSAGDQMGFNSWRRVLDRRPQPV